MISNAVTFFKHIKAPNMQPDIVCKLFVIVMIFMQLKNSKCVLV